MNETAVQKTEPGMGRLALILCAISAVCALLLGVINLITAGPIQQVRQQKTQDAMAAVLSADEYTQVDYPSEGSIIRAVYQAGDAGYVVEVSPSGFGGAINMMVGVGSDGSVTGVSFISMMETSGLGMNAQKDSFKKQFKGSAGPFAVTKDGGEIEAITGATITSRAVSNGVNAALSAVAEIQ